MGQQAPPIAAPPPYVIEVNWTDEETADEPGLATPISDVKPTDDPNVFERSGPVHRGQININRNRGPNNPYNDNSIYNIALHEFGHIFGLDHKTPNQDSEIMDETDISDPDKKKPIKDDDVRGLQDGYGRKAGSKVPPKTEEDDGDSSGMKCYAFESGGAFGCAMVGSELECESSYNGVIQEGVCVATGQDEQDGGIFGRCDGANARDCEDCRSSSGDSHYVASPSFVPPGSAVTFTAMLANQQGAALGRYDVTMSIPPGTELSLMQSSGSSFPSHANGAIHWSGCIPPGREIILSFEVRISASAAMGETLASTMILNDVSTRDTLALVASASVGDTATPVSYRWSFYVTSLLLPPVTIPMPDAIRTALVATRVVSLKLINGELPDALELTDYPWMVSGLVFNPGFFLPGWTQF